MTEKPKNPPYFQLEYYSINKVAEHLGCKDLDILKLAEFDKISLFLKVNIKF